jgi:hypothetical protein
VDQRDELENLITLETAEDAGVERRAKLMKGVSLPTHAATVRDLSMALKNLVMVMLERQAFNVPDVAETEPEPGDSGHGQRGDGGVRGTESRVRG